MGTWTDYVPQLAKYGVAAVGYPWDNAKDEDAMFAKLEAGVVKVGGGHRSFGKGDVQAVG